MQRWEYLFVRCGDVFVEDWRPRFINGRELEDWRNGPTVIEYCREAGLRGWELIAFSPGQTGLSIVFKRPCQRSSPLRAEKQAQPLSRHQARAG